MGPGHPTCAFFFPENVEPTHMFARGLLQSAVRALAFEGTGDWL